MNDLPNGATITYGPHKTVVRCANGKVFLTAERRRLFRRPVWDVYEEVGAWPAYMQIRTCRLRKDAEDACIEAAKQEGEA